MTQLRDAFERVGVKVTDWHKVQTSAPVNTQAARGIGGGNGEAISEPPHRTDDATLDEMIIERETLLQEREALLRRLHDMRAQISTAKANAVTRREFSDPGWFIGIQRKVKELGQHDQSILRRVADLRRAIDGRQRKISVATDEADPAALLKLALNHINRALDLLNARK